MTLPVCCGRRRWWGRKHGHRWRRKRSGRLGRSGWGHWPLSLRHWGWSRSSNYGIAASTLLGSSGRGTAGCGLADRFRVNSHSCHKSCRCERTRNLVKNEDFSYEDLSYTLERHISCVAVLSGNIVDRLGTSVRKQNLVQ